jgi:hypothetical protein
MGGLTPEYIAKTGSESAHQKALFCWAALPNQQRAYPELSLMFAIPNGGERNKIVAGNLKAEGVKAGVLDIFLPVARGGFHGLFVELKVDKNRMTPEQITFGAAVALQGYEVATCYSWFEAAQVIQRYLKI